MQLHKEHGLNPTIPVCFFCGKEKNQIALLGAKYKKEAPKNAILDYEPCDLCKNLWALGTTILEASTSPFSEGQPPLPKQDAEVYISGRYLVIRKGAINATANILLMLKEDFQQLYEEYNKGSAQ